MPELRSANLPASLAALLPLAYNLRWSWNPRTAALFERLDAKLWAAARQNPVYLLTHIDPITLEIATRDDAYVADVRERHEELERYLASKETWYQREQQDSSMRVAYFLAGFAIAVTLLFFLG